MSAGPDLPMKAFAIDFGTSNSAVAACLEDGQVQVARFASHEGEKAYIPTLLFYQRGQKQLYTGFSAIENYLESGMDGRLIQSIKAFLPSKSFKGTTINNRLLSIEQLIAAYLRQLMGNAEKALGQKLEGPVILGRPARFSTDPELEALAHQRLLDAAELAGLKDIQFLIEPVAAALSYEASLASDHRVLVADLGGGTSDFTVMQVGPSFKRQVDRQKTILGSGGLSVAGDAFDAEIVRHKLFPLLGHGSTYQTLTGPAQLPKWFYSKLLKWNQVSLLKDRKTMEFLERAQKGNSSPEGMAALLQIVSEDLGYVMYQAVEGAKRAVGEQEVVPIENETFALPIKTTMNRSEFVTATANCVEQISATASEVLKQAQTQPSEIDAVFMTGGTSLVKEVRGWFAGTFGGEKLMDRSTFTSVVDGLARRALAIS